MAKGLDQKKLAAGLIFLAIGSVAVALSLHLDIGTIDDLGPGGFPLLLGILLALLGLANAVASGLAGQAAGFGAWEGRALLMIPASVVVFALTIERFGLVPAVFAAALVAGLANFERRWIELVALSAVLAVFCAALFVQGLGLPFPLFEPF